MAKESVVKAPKAPKAKDPAREAQREKRRNALLQLQKEDPIRFHQKIGFKEAKALNIAGPDGKPIQGWAQYCTAKLQWSADYWKAAAQKPTMSDKTVAKKKAAFQKLKERLAKYEAELQGLLAEGA